MNRLNDQSNQINRQIFIINENGIQFQCYQKITQSKWIYDLVQKNQNKNIVSIKQIMKKQDNKFVISMLKYDSDLSEFRKYLSEDQIIRQGYKKILALNFLKQILDGYQLFYENGIAHRDIKPQNIVVVQNNQFDHTFLLADLDSAEQYDENTKWEVRDTTASFSAFEVYQNIHPLCKDQYLAQDIYSIGITFYFMLNNNLPFDSVKKFYAKQKGFLNLNQKWHNLLFDEMTKTEVEQRISYKVLKQKVEELFLTKQAKNIQLYFSTQQSQNDAYNFFKNINSQNIKSIPKIYCLQQIQQRQNSYVLKITIRHYQKSLQEIIRKIALIQENRRIIYALDFQLQILNGYKILYENKLYLDKINISVKEKDEYFYLIQNLSSIQFNMHNFQSQYEENQFFKSEIKKLGWLFKNFSQQLIKQNQFPEYFNLLDRMINNPNFSNFTNVIEEVKNLFNEYSKMIRETKPLQQFPQQKQQKLNNHDSRIFFARQMQQPYTQRNLVQNFKGDTSVPRSITPQNQIQKNNRSQHQSPLTPNRLPPNQQHFIQPNNTFKNQSPLTPKRLLPNQQHFIQPNNSKNQSPLTPKRLLPNQQYFIQPNNPFKNQSPYTPRKDQFRINN